MPNESIVRRVFILQEPSYVSKVIAVGVYGRLALLRDDPTRIFKFCAPDRQEAVDAIEQEKRMLEQVGSHPFIIKPLWVNERGLCLEYYPLGSLRSYYRDSDRQDLPPLTDRIRWCRQAVIGIAYLHSKRIVHNDISARNILLTSTLDIKICDFGCSVLIGEEVAGGPEPRYSRYREYVEGSVMEGSVLDDLFSMGSLFYEVLTGNTPYKELDSDEVSDLYQEHIFPSVDDIQPQGYGEITSKCWNEKYESILEMQADLEIIDSDFDLELTMVNKSMAE